jgi:hypothetical protein
MIKLKKVGAPKISPDGRFVIYSRVETSYNQDEHTSDLQKEARTITSGLLHQIKSILLPKETAMMPLNYMFFL